MTKVYKINGRRIESLWSDCSHKDLWMQVDQLLEALDEKKEEKIREPEGKQVSYPRDEKREKMAQDANYKNMPEYGEFWRNVKRNSIEEPKSRTHINILLEDDEEVENITYDGKEIWSKKPKSTLKEDIQNNLRGYPIIRGIEGKLADKIISLFKDTLLKEIEKVRNNYVMYEIEPYEKDIINLIKNL